MVDQYFIEIFEICDQSIIQIPIHVLKYRKVVKNAGNLIYISKVIAMDGLGLRTIKWV